MGSKDKRIVIDASLEDWEAECQRIAEAGKPFAVERIDLQKDKDFCKAIGDVYRYKIEVVGNCVDFKPQSPIARD
jgi:hypothetical protein